MNEPLIIDLEKWEPVNYAEFSNALIESISPIFEMVEKFTKMFNETIKPALKALIEIVQDLFATLIKIDFSHIINQFYFTSFATIDVSNIETRRNQLPKKIIEDESDSALSISYSAIYSDYKLNDSNNKMIESEIHKKVSNDNDAPLSNQPLLSTENLVITIIGAVATALFLLVDKEQLGMYQAFFLFFSFLTIFYNKD